jgi:hypothetical protein
MPTQILMSRLRSFETARDRLREARATEFKPGRGVSVSNDRYHGYGLIVADEGCPLDQIAVKLVNGNTWWYPIEDCSLANRDACPAWLQQLIKAESKTTFRRLGPARIAR